MGRQKTLWIDEESWQKLEEMGDDAISKKVRRCIMQHDSNLEKRIELDAQYIYALKKQIATLKDALNNAKIVGWWNE